MLNMYLKKKFQIKFEVGIQISKSKWPSLYLIQPKSILKNSNILYFSEFINVKYIKTCAKFKEEHSYKLESPKAKHIEKSLKYQNWKTYESTTWTQTINLMVVSKIGNI